MEPDERLVRKHKRWLIAVGLVFAFWLVGIRYNWFSSKGDQMLRVVDYSEVGGAGEEGYLNVTVTLFNPTKTSLLTARSSIDIRFFDLWGNRVRDSREKIEQAMHEPKDIFVIKPGEHRKIQVESFRISRFQNGTGFFQISWHSVDIPSQLEKEFEDLRVEKKGTYDVGSHESGKLFY